MNIFICLFFIFFGNFVFSEQKPKVYEISVCALFKNESAYLQEWIEYHRIIGVDHFYLYNNSSNDDFLKILQPYVDSGIVTLINWPTLIPDYLRDNLTHFALSTQIPAYENAAKHVANSQTEWLCFLNIDEFIVPISHENLKLLIEEKREYAAIELTLVEQFRATNLSESITRRLVTESHMRVKEEVPLETNVNKMLFRPEEYTQFSWFPYQCRFKTGAKIYRENRFEVQINKYTQRMKDRLNFSSSKRKLAYTAQEITEFELKSLLELGFEIEDREQRILKYVPELKRRIERIDFK